MPMNTSTFWKPLWCQVYERYMEGLWGWMSAAGPGELVRTGPRMNADEYVNILETAMVPSVRAIYGDEPLVFVQDNSAVHSSRRVRQWFQAHPQFTLLDWPGKVPRYESHRKFMG
ncbi:hypothetical protein QE152_g34189 [Popillia japonica]|uniref:Tc1-like transposase DDE domain-containing protein n=1 Tax=Popillia japonica TaxID=7064 RepID=A0AAW1IUT6_POPJA